MHLDDVLERRTRLSTEVRDRGAAAAEEVAAIVADELGWDEDRRTAEVRRYRDLMVARIRGEGTESDAAAAQALASADTDPTD